MSWINLLYVVLGGLTFRIRGGLRIPFTDKKFPLNKWWFAVWFAVLACILKGYKWDLFITSVVAGYTCTAISGWGSYIGALYSGKVSENDKDDLNITDFVQNELFPFLGKCKEWCLNSKYFKWLGKILPDSDYKKHGHLYGFFTLSLRGGLTTFLLGLAINSIPYCFVGLLQGLVYTLGGLTCKYIYNDGKSGWKISEWYWGSTLCLFVILTV